MNIFNLVIFVIGLTAIVYVVNCMIAKKIKRIDFKQALLYMSALAVLGVIAEFIIGNAYSLIFGSPLWEYTVHPIHNGHTSLYAPFLWSIYGLQIYLIHDTFKLKGITSLKILIPFICFEAILFEAFVNLGFIAAFGQYLYYYFPSDLFHLTSIQTLPLYFMAGFVITGVLTLERKFVPVAIPINTFIAVLVVSL